MEKEAKPSSRHFILRLNDDDRQRLDALANATSLTRAEVIKRLIRGERLKSTIDAQAFAQLGHTMADLGRLGGLLKWWLSGEERSPDGHRLDIRHLLTLIEERQDEVKEQMRAMSRPRTRQTP